MFKKVLILISLFVLIGCTNELDTINHELCSNINTQEYVYDNGFAGEGIYFYEKDSLQYCDYMQFGSGVPVVGVYTSLVTYNEDGAIILNLPYQIVSRDFESTSTELLSVTLIYDNKTFNMNGLIFEITDYKMHDILDTNQ